MQIIKLELTFSLYTLLLIFCTQSLIGQNDASFQKLNGNPFIAKSSRTFDYDKDGDSDIIALEEYRLDRKKALRLVWLENDEQHQFNTKHSLEIENIPVSANYFSIDDYNADGFHDFMITSGSHGKQLNGEFIIYYGLEKGKFNRKMIQNKFDFDHVLQNDFNRDGYIDIIVAGYTDDPFPGIRTTDAIAKEMLIFLGSPNEFSVTSINTGGNSVLSLGKGDLNNDGYDDLVYSSTNALHILENNKKGEFKEKNKLIIENCSDILSIRILDLNNDKKNEVLIIKSSNNYLHFEFFDPQKELITKPLNIKDGDSISGDFSWSISDINKDNLKDILTCESSKIYAYIQQKEMQFTKKLITHAPGAKSIQLIDIDGDKDQDLLSFNGNSELNNTYWFENENGNYICHFIFLGKKDNCAYQFMDIDSDGFEDIIFIEPIKNGAFILFKNYQNKGFKNYVYSKSIFAYLMGALDVDQDSREDAVAVTMKGELIWLKNSGKFELWSSSVIDSNLNNPKSILVEDVNKDNKKDIIVGCHGDSKLFYYRNLGMGKFSKTSIDLNIPLPIKILSADFNQDGNLDLAVLSEDSTALITIYKNTGNAIFVKNFQLRGQFGKDMSIFDINNDQKPDIIYSANGYKEIAFHDEDKVKKKMYGLVNDSNTFAQTVVIEPECTLGLLSTIDFNNDRKEDLVYSTYKDLEFSIHIASIKNGKMEDIYESDFDKSVSRMPRSQLMTSFDQKNAQSALLFAVFNPFQIIYMPFNH